MASFRYTDANWLLGNAASTKVARYHDGYANTPGTAYAFHRAQCELHMAIMCIIASGDHVHCVLKTLLWPQLGNTGTSSAQTDSRTSCST
jgi:hypothetical protein